MKRLLFVVLGLALLAGAAVFHMQHFWDVPVVRQKFTQQTSPIGGTRGAAPPTATRPTAPSTAAPADKAARDLVRENRTLRERLNQFTAFEQAVNVMNLLVGVLGIWFAVRGMRMQSAALRAMDRSR